MTDPIAGPVRPGAWREAVVESIEHPHERAVVLRLDVPDRIPHVPGQHYIVRLTAEDGYVAQRSYSVASAPADPLLELYVARLDDGEVSGFLADGVEVGDTLDVRGPIGGWFVWDASVPLVGVAGGTGVVPFVAMLRHARDVGRPELLHLAVAARTRREMPYADELAAAGVRVRITRDADDPDAGRLDAAVLTGLVRPDAFHYVCGSAAFSGAAVGWLRTLRIADDRVRVESFGPSG